MARLLLALLLTFVTVPMASAQAPTPETAVPVEAPRPPPAPPAAEPATRPAEPAAAPAPVTDEQARRLLALLRDDARRAEFIATLEAMLQAQAGAPPAAEPALPIPLAPDSLGAQLLVGASERLAALSDRLVATIQAVTDFPLLWRWITGLSTDPVAQRRIADAGWKLAVVLGLGILLEWLVWRGLKRPRERLDAAAPRNGAGAWLGRIPLVLLRVLLDLLPVLAFAIASYGLIGSLHPLPTTQLALLAANNAYIASRVAMVFTRALVAPTAPQLRLVPVNDETAEYITLWVRRIVLMSVFGYAFAETALLFGLHPAAYDALLKLVFLAVALLLVVVVLQNREAVAGLIRAPEGRSGAVVVLRNRMADVWHLLAIVYLLALWAVWALEVPDGFIRLLRLSGLTLAIGVAWKVADASANRAIGRAFRVSPAMAAKYPGLEQRANRYIPLLKRVVAALITVIALLLLFEAWGLDAFGWFARGSLGGRLVGALISVGMTIVIVLLVWEGVNSAINRHLAKLSRDAATARSARVRTLLPMLRTALMIGLAIFTILVILSEIGINIAPLLAGAGVVGLAIGFGSQRLVQDVITGIFLLLEDTMQVGDVVTLAGMSGSVEALSIRSIRLRALDGSVHIVPFSAVTTVTNQTRDFGYAVIDVNLGYEQDTDAVADVLRDIVGTMRKEARWERAIRADLDVMGVERLGDASVTLRARVMTDPPMRWAISRELNRRIKRRFAEEGIPLPVLPLAPAPPPPAPPLPATVSATGPVPARA